MQQGKYTVISNDSIALRTYRMRLQGDTSSLRRGGQFADVAVEGYFLRRPLAVTEWSAGGFSLIYKLVGKGTDALSKVKTGETLDILLGLGNGFDASRTADRALVVCGGLGASPAFSLVKELLSLGKEVDLVLGFNTAAEIILADEYRELGLEPRIVTMDGSCGSKGLVTDVIGDARYDYFYTCGPKVMMKAVCGMLSGSGELSLEERMGCGGGICYGCTCKTQDGPKRICKDGPVFKKEEVIW